MIRRACMLMLSLAMGMAPLASAQPAAESDVVQSAAAAAPAAGDYMAGFEALLDSRGIAWSPLGGDEYTLIINSALLMELAQTDGAIERVTLTAQGDGSARSGEVISDVLISALCAYAPIGRGEARARILELISQTGGADSAPGLNIALSWSAEALELTLTPADEAAPLTTPPPRPAPASLSELIERCAATLPRGWTLTSYLSGGAPDVLINIYAAATDPEGLWDCAHAVLSQYWSCVRDCALECGRLSMVFYSADTTPLLSLGIGRDDALGCAALEPGSTPDELRAALEQLAEDSDALLIQHYAP